MGRKHGTDRTRQLDLAFARYVPDAARLAFLLTGHAPRARRIALASFEHAFGSFADLRGSDAVEAHIIRWVVSHSKPRLGRAPARPSPGSDELWNALGKLRHRHRAALVVAYYEDLDADRGADVLQCSPSGFKALVEGALRSLRTQTDIHDLEDELRLCLQRHAERAELGARFTDEVVRVVRRRRALTSIGVAGLFAAAVMGAVVLVGSITGGPLAADRNAVPEVIGPEIELGRSSFGFAGICPTRGALRPMGKESQRDLERLAIEFNEAVIRGHSAVVKSLAVPLRAGTDVTWAHTATYRGVVVTASLSARKDALIEFACERGVARRAWKVVLHDRNGPSSRGLASYYFGRFASGVRIWASYEP